MPFEMTTTPVTPVCFVGKKGTAADDFLLHAGPGPAGSYPNADAATADAIALMGAPSNCYETQVFVADPARNFVNANPGD